MKRQLFVLSLISSMITVTACDDNDSNPGEVDAAAADSGPVATGDAGPTLDDSGTSDDSGTTTADSGTMADGSTGDSGPSDQCSVTLGAWSAPNWTANTAEAIAVRTQLDMLSAAMTAAEADPMTFSGVGDLTTLYEAGDPSLSDVLTSTYGPITQDAFADFAALIAVGPADLVDDNTMWTPGASGGIYGASNRGINAGGLEAKQIIDKGYYAAALYAYALTLTEGTIDESTVDAIAAAWGTNETFDIETRTDSADYAYDMGFHASITVALTEAKAYAADSNCAEERDEAIVVVFRLWEQALLARTVFYAHAGLNGLTAATDDDARASALHALAEGIGLALGFHGMPTPATGPMSERAKLISDAQIDTIMTALGVNTSDLSMSSTGTFVDDLTTFGTGVMTVDTTVGAVYGLSAFEIANYRPGSVTPG